MAGTALIHKRVPGLERYVSTAINMSDQTQNVYQICDKAFCCKPIGLSMSMIILLWKVSKEKERGDLFLESDDVSA